ncbi:MAG: hypothetical protein AB1627_11650 [Chloroflexota bacterium]
MAASSPTLPTSDKRKAGDAESALSGAVTEARTGIGETVDAVRRQAETVGDRVPEVIEAVRSDVMDRTRTLQSWPESRQRTLAAFSLGLGVGLAVTGAPRLLVMGSLAPALVVAATLLGRDGETALA